MDAHTISLVQQSWSQVKPIAPTAGKLFYQNLFEADPGLKDLFRGDMEAQAGRLMQMIDFAVGKLDRLPELVPTLQSLGERHDRYGVQPAHYDTVAGALLKTLHQGLGDAFTPPVKAAWTEVYVTMAGVMSPARSG